LSKLKQKYGDHLDVPSEIEGSSDGGDEGEEDDEGSDSEDSDVSSESLHDDPFDEQFLKVYSALKNKAPEIYDKDFVADAVAAEADDDDDDAESGSKSPPKGKAKKFTLQDYHKKLIKEKKG